MGRSKPLGYAVAYYRVSTAEQGLSGLRLTAQESTVQVFAAARGWRIVAAFTDVASGKSEARPGYQAALAECRRMGAFPHRRPPRPHHPPGAQPVDAAGGGIRPRTADMPDADDLMLRVYAAMAQRERELNLGADQGSPGSGKGASQSEGVARAGGSPACRPDAPKCPAGRRGPGPAGRPDGLPGDANDRRAPPGGHQVAAPTRRGLG